MQACPYCHSEFIFFSRMKNCYVCEECGKSIREESRKLRLFFSYGHDKNTPVVERIRALLAARGHEVWIDTSKIVANTDWRREITRGIIDSDEVVSFLSKHSVREPGVCLNEVQIAVGLKNERVLRILLEKESEVRPSSAISSRQWLDMSDWEQYYAEGGAVWEEWFRAKTEILIRCIEDPDNQQFDGDIAKLSELLRPIEHTGRERALLEHEFRGRRWLLDRFQKWKEAGTSKLYVLYGIPGSGKSTFASRLKDFDPDVIAGIFFDYARAEMAQPDNITNLLAFQIACRLPDYREYLQKLLKKPNMQSCTGIARFDALLIKPLRECIDGNRQTYVILIDALDEAYEHAPDMIRELVRCLGMLPGWLKIFLTSRPQSEIRAMLGKREESLLDAADADNNADIRLYLQEQIPDPAKLKQMTEKCEGCFLYADYVKTALTADAAAIDTLLAGKGGLEAFYYSDFCRKFPEESFASYRQHLPALEILCALGWFPERIFCDVLGLDRYSYMEFRRAFSDYLVSYEEITHWAHLEEPIVTVCMKFCHKSVRDWLSDPVASGKFFVDTSGNPRKLALYFLAHRKGKNNSENRFINEQLPRCLVDAEMYPEYIALLKEGRGHGIYWNQIGRIPEHVDLSEIVDVIVHDCARAQDSFSGAVSNGLAPDWNAFWTLVGSYQAMSHCLKNRQFAEGFFSVLNLPTGYFRSPFSDIQPFISDCKFQVASALSDCLDQLDSNGTEVPEHIRKTIDHLKLSVCFWENRPYPDTISEERDYKQYHYDREFCMLTDEDLKQDAALIMLRNAYNSICCYDYIRSRACESDEERAHIRKLVQYGADAAQVQAEFERSHAAEYAARFADVLAFMREISA